VDVRRFTARVLREAGYEVLEADGVEAGLTLARLHSGPIHLVLTDVMMRAGPGETWSTGFGTSGRQSPCLHVGLHRRHRAPAGGPGAGTAFLPKPVPPGLLLAQVRAVLDVEAARSGAPPGMRSAPGVLSTHTRRSRSGWPRPRSLACVEPLATPAGKLDRLPGRRGACTAAAVEARISGHEMFQRERPCLKGSCRSCADHRGSPIENGWCRCSSRRPALFEIVSTPATKRPSCQATGLPLCPAGTPAFR